MAASKKTQNTLINTVIKSHRENKSIITITIAITIIIIIRLKIKILSV